MNTATPKSESAGRFVTANAAQDRVLTIDDICIKPMFGLRFCDVTLDELLALVDEQVRSRAIGYFATPNVDHICRFHRDSAFRDAYAHARLVLCDGTPLKWAARLLGKPLRQKLSGSDLITWLSGHAADRGHSVYFFGAQDGVAESAASRLREQYPALKIAGVYSPPVGFHTDPDKNLEATEHVKQSGADIIYVALGSPKQEIWMRNNVAACGVPVMIGVGGAFDFVAGRVRRAPQWMQSLGCEWVWRLYQEPRRLWRRYLVEDLLFTKLFVRELFATYGPSRGRRHD